MHPYTFLLKVRHQKWRCGYLDIPLATNVASELILLDTAALAVRLDNRIWYRLSHTLRYKCKHVIPKIWFFVIKFCKANKLDIMVLLNLHAKIFSTGHLSFLLNIYPFYRTKWNCATGQKYFHTRQMDRKFNTFSFTKRKKMSYFPWLVCTFNMLWHRVDVPNFLNLFPFPLPLKSTHIQTCRERERKNAHIHQTLFFLKHAANIC